jgi:hypothetical protein
LKYRLCFSDVEPIWNIANIISVVFIGFSRKSDLKNISKTQEHLKNPRTSGGAKRACVDITQVSQLSFFLLIQLSVIRVWQAIGYISLINRAQNFSQLSITT